MGHYIGDNGQVLLGQFLTHEYMLVNIVRLRSFFGHEHKHERKPDDTGSAKCLDKYRTMSYGAFGPLGER